MRGREASHPNKGGKSRIPLHSCHCALHSRCPGDSSSQCEGHSLRRRFAINIDCFESFSLCSSFRYYEKKGLCFGNCCLNPLWCFYTHFFFQSWKEFENVNLILQYSTHLLQLFHALLLNYFSVSLLFCLVLTSWYVVEWSDSCKYFLLCSPVLYLWTWIESSSISLFFFSPMLPLIITTVPQSISAWWTSRRGQGQLSEFEGGSCILLIIGDSLVYINTFSLHALYGSHWSPHNAWMHTLICSNIQILSWTWFSKLALFTTSTWNCLLNIGWGIYSDQAKVLHHTNNFISSPSSREWLPYKYGNMQIFYIHLWHEYEIWMSCPVLCRRNWKNGVFRGL